MYRSARRVFIDIEYSVMKCSKCRETFTLYYYPSSDDVASSTFPRWKESPFIKIDTVAANSRFDAEEMRREGINGKTLVIDSITRYNLFKKWKISEKGSFVCLKIDDEFLTKHLA